MSKKINKIILNLLKVFCSPIFLVIIIERTLEDRTLQLYLKYNIEGRGKLFQLIFAEEFEKGYKDIFNFLNKIAIKLGF